MTTPQDRFEVSLEKLVMKGLTFEEACMALEAISSCAIEGITIKDEASLNRLVKEFKKSRKSNA